ncbi:MAG: hypothetical protein V1873_04695 [Verrucomicrobiota bacterium]
MKRAPAVLAVLLLSAAAAAAQTLANPSFEEQGAEIDLAAGWQRWGQWINRDCGWTPVRDGNCLMAYHHWQIETPDPSGFFQDFTNATPGKVYTFSLYANTDPAKDDCVNAESVELRLETTLYGQPVIVVSKLCKFEALAAGNDWSLLRVRAAAPTETLRVVVILTPAKGDRLRGGAIKFDQAALSAE